MPELPEVETIRRQIAPAIRQQTITSARVTRMRAVRAHATPDAFCELITRRRVLDVRRRGKALLFPLDNEHSMLVRLGMSGRLVIADPEMPTETHTHVVLGLSNGTQLRFIDPRTFGGMAVVAGHNPDHMIEFAHYGPEPLSDAFTPAVLQQACAGKSALIQAVLMDQSKVAGIGKIYADEACFLAGIHPQRQAASLHREEIAHLHTAIQLVLSRAVEARGTSTLDAAYRDADGSLGAFQYQLHVYQREGQPCRVCGTLIEYRPFQGRRMHFCPHCQR